MKIPDQAPVGDKFRDLPNRKVWRGISGTVIEHQQNTGDQENKKKIKGEAPQTERESEPDALSGNQRGMEMKKKGGHAAVIFFPWLKNLADLHLSGRAELY